jgi:hypothetical protein
MKFKSILASALVIAALASCVKHEIIPAPEPKVELVCQFIGTIDNTNVEWNQNVSGFYLESSKSKVVPPSGLSSAVYYSEIKSSENLSAMRLNIGQMKWDANVTSDPDLNVFNAFFTTNMIPTYTPGAVLTPTNTGGFEVAFRDASGDVWTSKDTDPANTIEFTNIVQESDKTGDYSKFVATFDCTVYHTFMYIDNIISPPDTTYVEEALVVDNGVFKGWYKK